MRATTTGQPDMAVIAPAPSNSEGHSAPISSTMAQVIVSLAELRKRYLTELQSARVKAKKNFLA